MLILVYLCLNFGATNCLLYIQQPVRSHSQGVKYQRFAVDTCYQQMKYYRMCEDAGVNVAASQSAANICILKYPLVSI